VGSTISKEVVFIEEFVRFFSPLASLLPAPCTGRGGGLRTSHAINSRNTWILLTPSWSQDVKGRDFFPNAPESFDTILGVDVWSSLETLFW
jgi:hypothetical protein